MYNNKTFRSTSNSSSGDTSTDTLFQYHQSGSTVWAEYWGGSVVRGSLIAKVIGENGVLDMRYQHVNVGGELVTGRCRSTPERLGDGRLRMHEVWQWTCGDVRIGRGVVEEVLGDGGV